MFDEQSRKELIAIIAEGTAQGLNQFAQSSGAPFATVEHKKEETTVEDTFAEDGESEETPAEDPKVAKKAAAAA